MTAVFPNALLPQPKQYPRKTTGVHSLYLDGKFILLPHAKDHPSMCCIVVADNEAKTVKITLYIKEKKLEEHRTGFLCTLDWAYKVIRLTRATRKLIQAHRGGNKGFESRATRGLFEEIATI